MQKKKSQKTKVAKNQTNVSALELHEQICAIRYENIEKRMESGSKRFIRMEGMIIGLYGTIIGIYILERLF